MPVSIQESLAKHGYAENLKESRFERYDQHIPYQELIGHTVDSFTEKATRKGWLTRTGAHPERGYTAYVWVLCCLVFLASCTPLMPKSFDQGLALGYTTQATVLHTATTMLDQKVIAKEDAVRILAISDQAGQALDSARAWKDRDLSKAQSQLALATAIFDQLSAYLNTRRE